MSISLSEGLSSELLYKKILFNLKIKVINLERSTKRWEGVTKTLDPLGIPYEKLNAVDGYKIFLVDKQTGKNFTGIDLSRKTASFELNHKYTITCNPDSHNPTFFDFAYLREQPFSPGLLGVYCSNLLIYKEIVENNYPYALICEDDIRIKPEKFSKRLALFIKNIPASFDLGYVGVYRDNDNVIPINSYVNKFAPDNGWFTRMAVLVSKKGAQKFLDQPFFFYSLDNYIQDNTKEGLFETYVATDSLRLLVSIYDDNQSDINLMLMGNEL